MQYRLGVDLGGTNIKAGVVDENYGIVSYASRPTEAKRPFEAVVASIAEVAREAAQKAGVRIEDMPCVGVGTPGSVQSAAGRVLRAANLYWNDVPLRAELQKHLPVPVYIGNDADCAAAGELLAGAARECDNLLLFTLGTGVGGGVIIDRKIYSGADGLGAELGHMILCYGGTQCTCGIKGCFEAYASVTGLIRLTRQAMERHPDSLMHDIANKRGVVNGRTAFDAEREGDAAAHALVESYIRYVAAGVGSAVSVFRPELVLIGGGISNEGENLLGRLNAALPEYVFASAYNGVPKVVRAALGNNAGAIGAAYLDIMQK